MINNLIECFRLMSKFKIMKSIFRKTHVIVALLFTFTFACKDEFLDERPLSTLSPENTFTDATGLQTVLDAAMKGVFNQWNGDVNQVLFNHNMSEASVVSATDKPDAFVDLRTYATPQNSRDNDAGRTLSFYAENYKQIKSCNSVIDYIDIPEWEGGENNPDRNHLLGSAYFLRAFYYLQLTMDFGNVAFPLNVVSEARQDFKVFHMQGIWDQMIADLEWAVKWVKPKSQIPVGQAPVDAVKMLLAKFYMLNERFSDAETLMTEVIDDPESRLFTDADVDVDIVRVGNNLNPFTGEELDGIDCNQPADAINLLHMDANSQKVNNPEGIWLVVNEPFLDGSQGRGASQRSWGPNFVSTNKGVKAPPVGTVTGMDIAQNERSKQMHKWGRGQGFGRPTNYSQYEIWNYDGGVDRQDYRHKRGNWFEMDMLIYDNPDLQGTEWYGKPVKLYHNNVLLCEDSIRCFYGYPLYKFYVMNQEEEVKRQDGGKRDIYIMREAEAYLIRAEARFWQGNLQGAADDINVIRERANAKYLYTVADIQEDGIGAILDERCREFYGEEYRHDELVRISVILAKTGQPCYNGKSYSWDGKDMEKSLSANNFYYDRQMERNNFFRESVNWSTYPTTRYTIDPKHIFWPVYEPYIIGNVENILNQTTGYDGSENNVEPLVHVVQPPGLPNIDPMVAIGER